MSSPSLIWLYYKSFTYYNFSKSNQPQVKLLLHLAKTFAHIPKSQKPSETLYNIFINLNTNFNMFINEKLFEQMFLQFLQTQASVPAPQTPNIRLKHTSDPAVFIGERSSIKQIHK